MISAYDFAKRSKKFVEEIENQGLNVDFFPTYLLEEELPEEDSDFVRQVIGRETEMSDTDVELGITESGRNTAIVKGTKTLPVTIVVGKASPPKDYHFTIDKIETVIKTDYFDICFRIEEDGSIHGLYVKGENDNFDLGRNLRVMEKTLGYVRSVLKDYDVIGKIDA